MISESLDFARPPLVELISNGKISPRPHAPPNWAQLIDNLRSLRNLDEDWDGQGASPPPAALVDGAIVLAQQLEGKNCIPADFALAGANGTILLEWQLASGYLEIEIAAADHAEGRWVRKGSETAEAFSLPIQT